MGANEVTDLSRFGLADDPRACASAATVAVPPRPTAGPDESTVSGALHGVYTAELIGITEGRPVVLLPQRTAALTGRSIVDLHGDHIGRQVVVMFDGGRPDEPIVMGWVRDTRSATVLRGGEAGSVTIDADGTRVQVSAATELVLRCGQASITLTKAGKVLIQGTYVSSRSSGVNRIKGGSVQLN